MPTPRILADPGNFKVTQNAVNVLSPPTTDENSFIFNSDWDQLGRLHALFTIPLQAPKYTTLTYFFPALAAAPVIGHRLYEPDGKEFNNWFFGYQNSGQAYRRSYYLFDVFTDRFTIKTPHLTANQHEDITPPSFCYCNVFVYRN